MDLTPVDSFSSLTLSSSFFLPLISSHLLGYFGPLGGPGWSSATAPGCFCFAQVMHKRVGNKTEEFQQKRLSCHQSLKTNLLTEIVDILPLSYQDKVN